MDKSLRYVEVEPNFDSAYNTPAKRTPQSVIYIPLSSSATFSRLSNRPSSPLFHRSISPPPRSPRLTGRAPKFNFDLYKMDENNNEYDDYSSPSYRSISPSRSSRNIYHYPIHSPISSPTSKSQILSKLRQINDELCQTLARSELTNPPSAPPHYHIHHYPVSQHSHRKHRSRSISEERSPSTELEVSPNIHKARVTYKIHIPRRYREEQQHRKSSRHMSPSDVYSSDDRMIVDLYPSRDQGFVKQIRKHSDNQSPWVVDGTSIRRNSYSDTSTPRLSQTPKGPYYGDKLIKSNRRSSRGNERPSSRTSERVWHPPSKTISERPPKYFERTLKSEYDGTESEPVSQRKTSSNRTKIRTDDPKFKQRIANTESKVKSAWEPSITSLTPSILKESKPPIPLPVKKTTISTPPKSKVKSIPSESNTPTKKVVTAPPTTSDTGRRSFNNQPTKPIFESTPRNENNDSVENLFENESHSSEQSEKEELPRSPPPIEKVPIRPQPQKPATQLPKTTVPEPDKDTKSTIKDGVLILGNDTKNIRNQNPTPSTTSEVNSNNNGNNKEASDTQNEHPIPPHKFPINHRKTPPLKPNNENNRSVTDNDADENDQEVARSFDINKWLNDASKSILGPSTKNDLVIPSTPPPQPPTKPKAKSPPRRRVQPPSPSDDENLYKPPFGPKKNDKKPSSPPPPPPPPATKTTTEETDELDDFFS